ncbi:MAG: twin-arginine translocase subunit TatB, partial [Chloroflexi bacterium]|nr:twin-arginine translocase subunit TatB [Chloroflexota bacterium]
MFNIGFGEILFIAVLALIFIGPERLPKVLRQLGGYTYKLRQVISELSRQYQDELKPLRDIQDLATNLNPGKLLDVLPSEPTPKADPPPPVSNIPMAEIGKIIQPKPAPT